MAKAMDLVEEVYRATREFPREEVFVLWSVAARGRPFLQTWLRSRAVVDERIFITYRSLGSLREVETQVIACRLAYIPTETERLLEIAGEVGRPKRAAASLAR